MYAPRYGLQFGISPYLRDLICNPWPIDTGNDVVKRYLYSRTHNDVETQLTLNQVTVRPRDSCNTSTSRERKYVRIYAKRTKTRYEKSSNK